MIRSRGKEGNIIIHSSSRKIKSKESIAHDSKRKKKKVQDENISFSNEFHEIDEYIDEGDQNGSGQFDMEQTILQNANDDPLF